MDQARALKADGGSMNEELKLNVANGIAVITLNRSEANNSLSNSIIEGLGTAYRRCDEDDDIRMAAITGARKAFSVGADMSGVQRTVGGGTGHRSGDRSRYLRQLCPFTRRIAQTLALAWAGHECWGVSQGRDSRPGPYHVNP